MFLRVSGRGKRGVRERKERRQKFTRDYENKYQLNRSCKLNQKGTTNRLHVAPLIVSETDIEVYKAGWKKDALRNYV